MNASALVPPAALDAPQVRLAGEVDVDMLRAFREGVDAAGEGDEPLVVELTTSGGDADIGQRLAADVRLLRERGGRRVLFFGKGVVYSAGVTIMSAFAREDRWLAKDTMLMVHGRSLNLTMDFNGPLAQERKRAEALLAQIDAGLKLERRGFETLIAGSDVSLDELVQRAQTNWYIDAESALERRLVAGVV